MKDASHIYVNKSERILRVGIKDCWNAFMVENVEFTENDIPICSTVVSALPKEIITWVEAKSIHKKNIRINKEYFCDAFVCFYVDDQFFDGPRSSVWTFPWLAIQVLKHFRGIITADFSTYQDFPYPQKVFNTYRMRAFGCWAGKQGLEVINNVRWGMPDTYSYCFDGIEKDSIVAIGTVGGSPRKLEDRERFEQGLYEMVKRLKPHTIIVYGSANYPCFEKLREEGIRIIAYPSHTCRAFERSQRR